MENAFTLFKWNIKCVLKNFYDNMASCMLGYSICSYAEHFNATFSIITDKFYQKMETKKLNYPIQLLLYSCIYFFGKMNMIFNKFHIWILFQWKWHFNWQWQNIYQWGFWILLNIIKNMCLLRGYVAVGSYNCF